MSNPIDRLSKFKEIKTIDPRVKVKDNCIYLRPFYFNYSFVINFVVIALFLYNILWMEYDSTINLFCYIGIFGVAIIIISALKYYNTIIIDLKKKEIIIQPNKILSIFIKIRSVQFEKIKNIFAISNINSTGFWMANRRYYITLLLKDEEEIKLVGSNKQKVATLIAQNISKVL